MKTMRRIHHAIYAVMIGVLIFTFAQCLNQFLTAATASSNLIETLKIGTILVLASSPIPVLILEFAWIFGSDGNWRDSSLARLSKFNFSRESDLALWVSTQAGILPASVYLFLNTLNISPPASLAEYGLHLSELEFIALPLVHFSIALLTASFIDYLVHVAFHKIPELWELHRVHHSASEMTVLNTFREHFAVTAVNNAATVLVFYFLGLNREVIFAYLMIRNVHSYFIHSNWISDWGFVGKILVSPLAHRIHHADAHEFHNCNYGTDITLWDRIFRTYRKPSPAMNLEIERDSFSASNPLALIGFSTINSLSLFYRRMKYMVGR